MANSKMQAHALDLFTTYPYWRNKLCKITFASILEEEIPKKEKEKKKENNYSHRLTIRKSEDPKSPVHLC